VKRAALLVALSVLLTPTPSRAQGQVSFRGFGDAGLTVFTATKSFKAILDKSSGPVFGGGIQVGFPSNLFVSLGASRFHRTGRRVFVFNNEVFPLAVDDTITVTPLDLTAGYRFGRRGTLVPYAGGGVSWVKFEETSAHSTEADDVKTTHVGFHVAGGVEIPLGRLIGAGVDATWSAVPNGLGDEPSSVAHLYDEHDLGGFTLRARIILGR